MYWILIEIIVSLDNSNRKHDNLTKFDDILIKYNIDNKCKKKIFVVI